MTGKSLHTVLIIEDSDTMRGFLRTCMQVFFPHIRVLEAVNGFDAIRLLPQESVDLIITDINMPDVNGLELIRFLKSHPRYGRIPVIIVSTERTERDRQRGLAMGAEAYLAKPFRPEVLIQTVREIWHRVTQVSGEEHG